jgi:hypothetical protein
LLSKYRPRFQIWGKSDAPANLAVSAKTLKQEEPLKQARKMSIERNSMDHRSTSKTLAHPRAHADDGAVEAGGKGIAQHSNPMPGPRPELIGAWVRVQCSDGCFYEGRIRGWDSKIAEYLILLDDGDKLSSPIDANSWDVEVLSVNTVDAVNDVNDVHEEEALSTLGFAASAQSRSMKVDETQERGEAWVGRSFIQKFQGCGRFKGTIVRYQAESELYLIAYEDGDTKMMNEQQVHRQLYPPRGKRSL